MFSNKLKLKLESLNIDSSVLSNNGVRMAIEDRLDASTRLVNTVKHSEYLAVQEVYSIFMEEYNEILDLREIVN